MHNVNWHKSLRKSYGIYIHRRCNYIVFGAWNTHITLQILKVCEQNDDSMAWGWPRHIIIWYISLIQHDCDLIGGKISIQLISASIWIYIAMVKTYLFLTHNFSVSVCLSVPVCLCLSLSVVLVLSYFLLFVVYVLSFQSVSYSLI